MEILGHAISDTEIIGISALRSPKHPDERMVAAYQAFRFEFDVYTRQNTIAIRSEYFTSPGNTVSEEMQNKRAQFLRAYVAAYKKVWDLSQGGGDFPKYLTDIEDNLDNHFKHHVKAEGQSETNP